MKTIAISAVMVMAMVSGVASAQSADAPRSAATVVDITGNVMMNKGEQFVAAPEGVQVAEGDRVMALEGSGAILRFEDGCDVKVEPSTVVTLNEGSPCAGWLLAVDPATPSGLALGSTAAGGISPWIYVPAAVIAAVIIYDELDDGPSSP